MESPDTQGHPRRWQILAVLSLSVFVVVMDNTILNVAIPSLLKDLNASTSDVQWVIDAYSLLFAGLLLTAGSLGDRYGRRRAMLIGFALFGGGSLLAAFAGGPGMLAAMRAVMGIGGALLMPGTLSIMAQVFAPQERAKAFAIWGTASIVAIAAGPTIGGFLLQHFWWGSAFLVNVPVTVVAVLGLLVLVPESRGPRRRPDLLGALLSTLGMSALIWSIISGPEHGWTGVRTLGGLAVAAAALGSFVAWQHRNPEPMLDLGLLRKREFGGAAAVIALSNFTLAGVLFTLTQFLQLVLTFNPLQAGLAMLPVAVAAGVGNGLCVKVDARIGSRWTIASGTAVTAAGFALLGIAQPGDGYLTVLGGLVVLAFGAGLGTLPAYNMLMGAVPREDAGIGSAVNDSGQELGNALGVAVVGSVLSALYARDLPDDAPAAARHSLGEALGLGDAGLAHAARDSFVHAMSLASFSIAAVTFAVAAFAAVFFRHYRPPAQSEVPSERKETEVAAE